MEEADCVKEGHSPHYGINDGGKEEAESCHAQRGVDGSGELG